MWKPTNSIGVGSVLTIIAAVASAIVPLVIWQLDRSAQAIVISISSSVGLKLESSPATDGLEVTFEQERLSAPFLSTIEIAVAGPKPILASAFESPLQISVGTEARIIRATVEASAPEGIKPSLIIDDAVIEILPLLLNSGDTITLAVLTDGAPPHFNAQARIAGIPKIELETSTGNVVSVERSVFSAIGGLTGLFLYFHFAFAAICKSCSVPPSRAAYLVAAAFGVAMFLMLASSFEKYSGIEMNANQKMAVAFAMFLIIYLPRRYHTNRATRIQARRRLP